MDLQLPAEITAEIQSRADRAMQVHGGADYSRHMPFEPIHRRYRITEGSAEVRMRRVAQYRFGFGGKRVSPCTTAALGCGSHSLITG